MKKIKDLLKNKFIIIGILIFTTLILAFIIFLFNSKKKDDEESYVANNNSKTNTSLEIEIPQNWNLNVEDSSIDSAVCEYYEVISPSEDFLINISYEFFSESYSLDDYLEPFDTESFETLGILGSNVLLVSNTGAFSYDSNSYLVCTEPIIDKNNYVFQEYLVDNNNYFASHVINLNSERGIVVSYKFNTEEAILKWSGYKEVLKTVIESIEKK